MGENAGLEPDPIPAFRSVKMASGCDETETIYYEPGFSRGSVDARQEANQYFNSGHSNLYTYPVKNSMYVLGTRIYNEKRFIITLYM